MRKKKQAPKSSLGRVRQNVMTEAVRRGAGLSFAISFIIAGILGSVFYYFFLGDALKGNDALRTEIEKKEAENLRGQAIEKSQPAFENEFRQLVNLSDSAEPLLPNETELAQVLTGVQEIARRQNIKLTGMNAVKDSQKSAISYKDERNEVKTADKVYEREIPAQVTGDYSSVVRFYYDLAKLSRIIVVKDFQLLAGTGNNVTASFTLATFHAPPPSEIEKVAPLPPFVQKTTASIQTSTDQQN